MMRNGAPTPFEGSAAEVSPGTKRGLTVCVLAFSVLMAAWTIGDKPLIDHECFVSVTAREMARNGNWIIPTFNGQPRLRKTPLPYWLVAMTSRFTGTIDEFSARFPSAAFAVASAAAILTFANGWFGFRAAVLSTLLWSTSLGYLRYSHSARPEMAVSALTAISMLAFFSAVLAAGRGRRIAYALVFWACFALGNLAKGPAPLPLVIPPVLLTFLVFEDRKLASKLLPIPGTLLFLAILLPWPIAVMTSEPNWMQIWKHEYLDRFFGSTGGSSRPFTYYLQSMFVLGAPWSAFIPLALAAPFVEAWNGKSRAVRLLWLWFVSDVVVMSFATGKRVHYLLPAMPAMAVLSGVVLDDMAFRPGAPGGKLSRNFLAGHLAVLAIVAVGIPLVVRHKEPADFGPALVLCALALAGAVCATTAFALGRPALAIAVAFGGCGALAMTLTAAFANHDRADAVSKRSAIVLKQSFPAPASFKAYRRVSAKTIHYFERPIPLVLDRGELLAAYDAGDFVLVEHEFVPEIDSLGLARHSEVNEFEVEKGRTFPAVVFRKPDDHRP